MESPRASTYTVNGHGGLLPGGLRQRDADSEDSKQDDQAQYRPEKVDALAAGTLNLEQFQQKVLMTSY